ncbi:MAG: hypothetical protein H6767_04730 [Candidatus Peribacteria bacterium]|nr:MAG: hypothetical protein H6767_04730 [Candidatus Peribacteria bacterium]
MALGGEIAANDPVQAQVRETKIDINGKLMTILWANQLPIVGSLFAKLPHSDNVSMLRQARQIKMLEFDAQ